MGGAPSLADEIGRLQADVWISANEHGAKLRPVDYVVAMDDRHGGLKTPMRGEIRKYTDAPIIGPAAGNDYQLVTWPGAPRKGLSGMAAAWVAWVMGAHPVILAGFDAYGGAKLSESRKVVDHIKGVVRVAGGPLTAIWQQYRASERLGAYAEHSSIRGLLGIDETIRIRVRKPTMIRDRAWPKGAELRIPRHEVARLLRHRMVEEI